MPTVRFEQVAVVVSIVTIEPVIVTLSAAVGTTPPPHVPVALQFPPPAFDEILAAVAVKTESASNAIETAAHRVPFKPWGVIAFFIDKPRVRRLGAKKPKNAVEEKFY